MSDNINEVRTRLEIGLPISAGWHVVQCLSDDLRALLDDHARLNELLGSSEQLPAIDLGQLCKTVADAMDFIAHCSWAWNGTGPHPNTIHTELQSLLALIHGQVTPNDTHRLEWLMRNISGAELRRLNVCTAANCDREAIDDAMSVQPTKGEGE